MKKSDFFAFMLMEQFLFLEMRKTMSVKNQPLFVKLMACSVAALIGVSAMPGDAVAGFKWQGPAKSEATVFPDEKTYMEPEIRWHGEGNNAAPTAELMDDATMVDEALPAPVTSETLGSLSGMESYPEDSTQNNGDLISQIVSDAPQTSATAPAAAPVLFVENAEMAQGFGSDIPLVMAIRQIIPSSQAFAFEPGVDLGAPVSWQGGAPWPEVLSNTLSAAGLYARMHRDMVIIGKYDGGAAPAPVSGGEDHAAFDAPVTSMTASAPTQSTKPQTEIEKSMAGQSGGMMTAPASDTGMNSPDSAPVAAAAPQWSVTPGQTLRDAVTSWATEAGVKLYWTTDYDYRIDASHVFQGSFEEALAQLLDTFADTTPQPYGQLHKSSEGGQILVIKTYDSNLG
ncbi:MAG: hypothetical protein D8M28_06205 [Proteobacteria bacterium]|nr:hypothetical protein [Pseudomonadota bacterium]